MGSLRSFHANILSGILALLLFVFPKISFAGDGGHQQAQQGQQLGMILGLVGAGTIAIGVGMLASDNPAGAVFVAMGIAEVAGAAVAASNNAKTADQTKNDDATAASGSGGSFSLPTVSGVAPGTSMADLCAKAAGVCTCTDPSCTTPTMTLPKYDDIKANMVQAYATDPNAFKGVSLDDALAKLDNNYGKAQELANNFNKASQSGAFDPAANNGSTALLAGDGDLHKLKDGNGKRDNDLNNKGAGDNTAGEGGNGTNVAAKAVNTQNAFASLTGRDARRGVLRRSGLEIEDERSGRLLTIFERVSRAIRGEHDRDLVLARVEWARKEITKQNKKNLKHNSVATVAPAK